MKTVSRVINREPNVNAETRRRVNEAIEALGYRPNTSARALAGARSYLIGLYVFHPGLEYIGRIERGAMAACRKAGFHLIVEQLDGIGPDLPERLDTLHSGIRMDGVILTPPICDREDVLALLRARKVRYARIAPAHFLEEGGYVHMDDRRAAYEMTAYLQGLGHRRIAFIQGPGNQVAAVERMEGFMQAMREAGLGVPADRMTVGDFHFLSGRDCAEQLLQQTARPTAIFAANDAMALGVMAAAHKLNIDIPGELSVVGFDDSPSAQVVWPQLTTVRQPVAEMAFAAAEMLFNPAPDEPAPTSLLDFELVLRDSTGPCKS